jgi:hypothetical protein
MARDFEQYYIANEVVWINTTLTVDNHVRLIEFIQQEKLVPQTRNGSHGTINNAWNLSAGFLKADADKLVRFIREELKVRDEAGN